MATNPTSTASPASTDDFGEQIGLLKSTSESRQLAIIGISLLSWGAFWHLQIIGGFVFIIGSLITMLGLYVVSLDFGDSLQVFEGGLVLQKNKRTVQFSFDEVTSISAKHTHHYVRRTYIATKATLTFELESRFTNFVFECDHQKHDSKESLIQLALEQCSESIQLRLLGKLKTDGQVLWKDNIYLTQHGLKIAEPEGATRVIPFADIEELKMDDNQLKIWKRGDVIPFLALSNDTANFAPLLGLFRQLTATSHEINSAEATASVERLAVAATTESFD